MANQLTRAKLDALRRAAQERLQQILQGFRRELDADPNLATDEDFGRRYAQALAESQRLCTKYDQLLGWYAPDAAPIQPQAEGPRHEGEEMPIEPKTHADAGVKGMLGRLAATTVSAAKRGVAKQASRQCVEELRKAFGDKYPAFLTQLPPDMEAAAVCLMTYMLASMLPMVPSREDVADVSLLALEGLQEDAAAMFVGTILPTMMPQLTQAFKSIALFKATSMLLQASTAEDAPPDIPSSR